MEIIFSILIVGLEFDQVFPIIHHKVQAVQNYSKVRETNPKYTIYVIRCLTFCLTQIFSFVSEYPDQILTCVRTFVRKWKR